MGEIIPFTNHELDPKTLEYKPCVVVMGRTGAGKPH
jgi:hypothetical protein